MISNKKNIIDSIYSVAIEDYNTQDTYGDLHVVHLLARRSNFLYLLFTLNNKPLTESKLFSATTHKHLINNCAEPLQRFHVDENTATQEDMIMLGDYYRFFGIYPEAIKYYTMATTKSPTDIHVLLRIASYYQLLLLIYRQKNSHFTIEYDEIHKQKLYWFHQLFLHATEPHDKLYINLYLHAFDDDPYADHTINNHIHEVIYNATPREAELLLHLATYFIKINCISMAEKTLLIANNFKAKMANSYLGIIYFHCKKPTRNNNVIRTNAGEISITQLSTTLENNDGDSSSDDEGQTNDMQEIMSRFLNNIFNGSQQPTPQQAEQPPQIIEFYFTTPVTIYSEAWNALMLLRVAITNFKQTINIVNDVCVELTNEHDTEFEKYCSNLNYNTFAEYLKIYYYHYKTIKSALQKTNSAELLKKIKTCDGFITIDFSKMDIMTKTIHLTYLMRGNITLDSETMNTLIDCHMCLHSHGELTSLYYLTECLCRSTNDKSTFTNIVIDNTMFENIRYVEILENITLYLFNYANDTQLFYTLGIFTTEDMENPSLTYFQKEIELSGLCGHGIMSYHAIAFLTMNINQHKALKYWGLSFVYDDYRRMNTKFKCMHESIYKIFKSRYHVLFYEFICIISDAIASSTIINKKRRVATIIKHLSDYSIIKSVDMEKIITMIMFHRLGLFENKPNQQHLISLYLLVHDRHDTKFLNKTPQTIDDEYTHMNSIHETIADTTNKYIDKCPVCFEENTILFPFQCSAKHRVCLECMNSMGNNIKCIYNCNTTA